MYSDQADGTLKIILLESYLYLEGIWSFPCAPHLHIPPTLRLQAVCLCLNFTFLHTLARKRMCRRMSHGGQNQRAAPLSPLPVLLIGFSGVFSSILALLEVQRLCLCDLEYKWVPPPTSQALLSCPILHVLVAWLGPLAMLIKRFRMQGKLQRWKCATWWVCLRIDGVQGLIKWKWGSQANSQVS